MKHNSFVKHNDGRMLAVVWPEKPKSCQQRNISSCRVGADCPHNGTMCGLYEHDLVKYKRDCEQAIANGIKFKKKEDIEKLEIICFAIDQKYEDINFIINFGILYPHIREKFEKWSMPKMKPYDVPEGIEVLSANGETVKHGNLFAFIKHKPKEEVESQAKNKLIKDITQKYYGARADAGDSSLSLISDFEVWLINYMEGYTVERLPN